MPAIAIADVGLIGLAVMGENLALNISDHGYKVAVYNRTTEIMGSSSPARIAGRAGGLPDPAGTRGRHKEAAQNHHPREGRRPRWTRL